MSFEVSAHGSTAPKLSEFMGNKLRGALGRQLHGTPIYDEVFKAEGGANVQQPYVIGVDYPISRDSHDFSFYINLFGSAIQYAEQIEQATSSLLPGYDITCTSNKYVVWSDENARSIAPTDKLKITLLTPLQILNAGMLNTEPDFEEFMASIFGRISGIIDNHTDSEFEIPYSMVFRKPRVTAEFDLKATTIKLERPPHILGIMGTITYKGDATRYLPYIDLGTQLHAGKLATRGCGGYVFEMKGGN
jgi:hypothetical protein